MQVGERIAMVIQAQGRRKTWVAREMGISPSYLTRLLTGERPWLPHLQEAAARVLGIPREVLFLVSDCHPSDSNVTDKVSQESA
jgi:transcriptional regulator with XRE-family HTH domain